jgi:hypothetical protein
MSHSPPPVPPEQRSSGPQAAAGQDANTEGAKTGAETTEGLTDARDNVTNVMDGQPGDAGVNTSEQGRFGGIKQNTTHQGLQQDR